MSFVCLYLPSSNVIFFDIRANVQVGIKIEKKNQNGRVIIKSHSAVCNGEGAQCDDTGCAECAIVPGGRAG